MHPADQVVAFTTLSDAGLSVAAIAARFGLAERLVEQRLRLGNAAPQLLDAYRADEIDLEVLKAFAVTTDRERQMAVWQQIAGHREVEEFHLLLLDRRNRLLRDELHQRGTVSHTPAYSPGDLHPLPGDARNCDPAVAQSSERQPGTVSG